LDFSFATRSVVAHRVGDFVHRDAFHRFVFHLLFVHFEISISKRLRIQVVYRFIIFAKALEEEEVMYARKCYTINGAQSSFPQLLRTLSRDDDSDDDDDFFFSKGFFLAFSFFDDSKRFFFAEESEEDSPRESRDGFCVCGCCICAKEEYEWCRCRWRQLLYRDDDDQNDSDDEEFTTLYNLVELLRDEERFR